MNTIQESLTSVFDANNTPAKQGSKQPVGINPASGNELEPVVPVKHGNTTGDGNFFEEIKENLKKINDFISVSSTNLIFEFDELGEPPVVKVIDKSNDEVIREIPPQEIREVAKAFENLADKLNTPAGVLFNDSV
ncbi:flagellar protein FlaG [Pseudoalteromonas sp.]|uniref:flagellar protein FlaG n=1 Tax=Pseudoalteromonas sp. TaxID=53249 RepID=UPI003561DF4B